MNDFHQFQEAITELTRSFQYMLDEALKGTTQVYSGIVIDGSHPYWQVQLNGKTYTIKAYGSSNININDSVKVIVPQGNMNVAFILPFDLGAGSIVPLVANADSIVPTGTYANSTYYNTGYGVKIGYTESGDIILSMQGGTATSYPYLYFNGASLPTGVSLSEAHNTSTTYRRGCPGLIYSCIFSGVANKCNIAIEMNNRDDSLDNVQCDITLTYIN